VIDEAAATLRAGGLVAFPTETVYGLGAHALDADAVRRIFAAKGRPADNPLIVHLGAAADLDTVVASVSPLARRLAARYWPGPLTLVLPAAPEVPAVTRGGLATVAVRVPDHPVALRLLRAAGVPVAAPSANRSGRPSPTTADHVRADLGDTVDVIVDGGPCELGVESTVVDASGEVPVVLREGMITREELGVEAEASTTPDELAASPGTRYRHYRPACRVQIAPRGGSAATASQLAHAGERVGLVGSEPVPPDVIDVARVVDAADLAARLYGSLRAGEAAGVDVLVVEAVDEAGVGRAVMDRLRRAATDP
jgi:L-threonylcarbamoyladenylate synthase